MQYILIQVLIFLSGKVVEMVISYIVNKIKFQINKHSIHELSSFSAHQMHSNLNS